MPAGRPALHTMRIHLETKPYATLEADAIMTYAFDKDNRIEGVLAELDKATGGRLTQLSSSGELTGKMLETTLIHFPPGLAAARLLVVGAGKQEKFTTAELRRVAGAALRHLKAKSARRVVFLARENDRGAAAAQAVTEGLIVANFESDKYKTDKTPKKEIESAALVRI
jgi:Leucyl aminopeptidase